MENLLGPGLEQDQLALTLSPLTIQQSAFEDIGLSAESISLYLQDLVEFSRDAIIPLSQISSYIKEKIEEKKKLEEEIEERKIQLETLEKEKRHFESLRDQALQEQKITFSELKWYSSLKQELQQKYSIPIEEISNFAKLVDNIDKHYDYDAGEVIKEFSDLDILRTKHDSLKENITTLQKTIAGLEAERVPLQILVDMNNQTISKYKDLEAMGFGLHELTFLSNTVNEIAFANDIPAKQAVKKFLTDVEEQYDKKLGFESKIDKLQIEVNKLGRKELKLLDDINAIPNLGIGVAKLLYLHHDDSKSTSIEELQLLIDQVLKCGGIKASINKLLSQPEQHDKERHDVETRAEALVLVDYQTNKSSGSSNEKKIEKEREPVVAAVGQDSNHGDEFIEAQFRSMVKEPPEPPSMRALLASNGNNSNNDSSTIEYFKLKRDQLHGSSVGVTKQIGSQRTTEEKESKKKEQEKGEQLRSLQQKIKDIDDRSHYYVP